jgi:hypothetical protein
VYLKREGVDAVFDDATLSRFLYSENFKLDDACDKISQYYEWLSDPTLQTLPPQSREIL